MKRWIHVCASTKLKKKEVADIYAKYMTEHYDRQELEKYKSEISQIAQIASVSYDVLIDALLDVIFDSYYAFATHSQNFEWDSIGQDISEQGESEAIEYYKEHFGQYNVNLLRSMYVDIYGVVMCDIASANGYGGNNSNRYYQLVDNKHVAIDKINMKKYQYSRYSPKRCAAYLDLRPYGKDFEFENRTNM